MKPSAWNTSRWSPARIIELCVAFAALALSLILNNVLGRYADRAGEFAHTSPDLLLRLPPHVDLTILFVWGFAAFIAFAFVMGFLREGRRGAHIVWLYALLITLRSLFIVLTPMKLPEDAFLANGSALFDSLGRHLTFKHDLFFSSHTALPFMGFLAYRDLWVRRVFLAISIVLAATVLLAHQHYSIDVFSAYFITYALYRFERRWMRAPYRRARERLLGRFAR